MRRATAALATHVLYQLLCIPKERGRDNESPSAGQRAEGSSARLERDSNSVWGCMWEGEGTTQLSQLQLQVPIIGAVK